MNIDVNMILVIALVASVIGHIIGGFWNYKIMIMVLRALAPSLRHRTPPTGPMPPLFAPEHKTEDLGVAHL